MKLKIILISALLTCPLFSEPDLKSILNAFERLLLAGDSEQAINTVFATNPVLAIDIRKDIEDTIIKLKEYELTTGKINRIIDLGQTSIADTFTQQSYLVIYDYDLLRFEFQFFRTNSGWKILGYHYDTEIGETLRLSARRNIMADLKGTGRVLLAPSPETPTPH